MVRASSEGVWLIYKWLSLLLGLFCSGFKAHVKIPKHFREGKTYGGREKSKQCNCRYLKMSHPSVFHSEKQGGSSVLSISQLLCEHPLLYGCYVHRIFLN